MTGHPQAELFMKEQGYVQAILHTILKRLQLSGVIGLAPPEITGERLDFFVA